MASQILKYFGSTGVSTITAFNSSSNLVGSIKTKKRTSASFTSSSSLSPNVKRRMRSAVAFNTISSLVPVFKRRVKIITPFNTALDFYANLQLSDPAQIFADFTTSSKLFAAINNLYGSYRFRSRANFAATPHSRVGYGEVFSFLVDTYPSASASTYQRYTCRFLANGIEYPIKKFTIKYPRNSIGMSLDLTMARISDHEEFTNLNSTGYKFEIGITTGGVMKWYTIIEKGILDNKSHSISFSRKGPTDTLSISSISALNERMTYSPQKWTILYDVNRVEISETEIKPIPDTAGNLYSAELKPFNPLTLHDILDYVTKSSGFGTYKTNIPNFQVKRLDLKLTDSYNGALSGIIGPFKPLITLIDNVLWFLDTTIVFPSSFPAPKTITLDNLRSVRRNSSFIPVDGYLVDYIENELEGGLFIDVTEVEENATGTYGTSDYQLTRVEKTIRKYYRAEEPHVYTKEVERRTKTTVYDNLEIATSENIEDFSFDSYGRLSGSVKTYSAMVPDVLADGDLTFLTLRTETETIRYGAHPFKPSQTIQLYRTVRAEGMVASDSENQYFGDNFLQDYVRAHEAGNLTTAMTRFFAPLWTVTESTRPTNNGQVKVYVQKIDHLRNTVTNTISASRSGDVSLSGVKSSSKQVVVLSASTSFGKQKRIESFNLAEIPTSIGIPLVKRWIIKNNEKNSQINFEWIGFDPYLQRGMIREVLGRDSYNLGKYIISDIQVEGDNMGSREQIVITTLSGEEV